MKNSRNVISGIAASVICIGLSISSAAQEWTRFRGLNGSGIAEAPNLPATFTEKDYNWNIELPGTGHSCPVIWGEKIFVTCADRETGARRLVCISAKTGEVAWKKDIPSHAYQQHKDNDYASSTPAVDEKHVYVAFSTPEEFSLVAFDHTGNSVWKIGLGRFTSKHGSGISPVVAEDMVLMGVDQEGPKGAIFGINRNTGKKIWETPREAGTVSGMSASTPVLLKNSDGAELAVFCSRYEGIAGLDPKTGKIVWQMRDAFKYRTVGSPVAMGNSVLGFSGEGTKGHEFLIVHPDGSKAKLNWELKEGSPYVPTPLFLDNRLYVLTDVGNISCYDSSTGKVIWSDRIGTAFYSSLVCTGNKIFAVSKKGDVTCFATGEPTVRYLNASRICQTIFPVFGSSPAMPS